MNINPLTLIHTSPVLIPMFTALAEELLPDIHVSHVADDSLIKEAIACGGLNPGIVSRLQAHIAAAEASGARAIMVTCSSMGKAIEQSQAMARVPLMRVDQAMAERAVALGEKIGVVATVSTTLGPTVDLIHDCAAKSGRDVQVTPCLCEGALEKLLAGDVATHDAMVKEKLNLLMQQVDVIVLAQASMARVSGQLDPATLTIPVLSSPRLAFEKLAQELNAAEDE